MTNRCECGKPIPPGFTVCDACEPSWYDDPDMISEMTVYDDDEDDIEEFLGGMEDAA